MIILRRHCLNLHKLSMYVTAHRLPMYKDKSIVVFRLLLFYVSEHLTICNRNGGCRLQKGDYVLGKHRSCPLFIAWFCYSQQATMRLKCISKAGLIRLGVLFIHHSCLIFVGQHLEMLWSNIECIYSPDGRITQIWPSEKHDNITYYMSIVNIRN